MFSCTSLIKSRCGCDLLKQSAREHNWASACKSMHKVSEFTKLLKNVIQNSKSDQKLESAGMYIVLTQLCLRLWPLAAVLKEQPPKLNISSGQTHQDLFLMTIGWRSELTTQQDRVYLWREHLIAGTTGFPPLVNGHWAHSDSETNWCFFLEGNSYWSCPWYSGLFADCTVRSFLSVSADLVADFD